MNWLPMAHIIIGNMKTFINGTFHCVTHKYLQYNICLNSAIDLTYDFGNLNSHFDY